MNKLYKIHGKNPNKMTLELLNAMNPLLGYDKNIQIGIKPNLVCATPASHGATTHVEIIEGIIIYLLSNSFENIVILEGSWIGDSTKRAYDICGYNELSKKYSIPLIDTKDSESITKTFDGMDLNICKNVDNLDYLINVPLIKGHCQTKITCALKNLKGLIPDSEKRRYHTMGLHKPIAYLNKIIRQDLIIADAISPDPYFEEGGSPKQLDTIVAGYDPVLMDSYAAKMLGYKPFDIKYIKLAYDLGIGTIHDDSTEIISLGENLDDEIIISQKERKYLNIIEDANACSACYSNLVMALKEIDVDGYSNNFCEQICIGQHYRGYKGVIGIGDCTHSFKQHIKGCPPNKDEIYEFLLEISTEKH